MSCAAAMIFSAFSVFLPGFLKLPTRIRREKERERERESKDSTAVVRGKKSMDWDQRK